MKKTLTIQRKAHYYIQVPNKKIITVLIVLHGYGQKAEDFIHEFKKLKSSNILVIAPEAISKFYNKKGEAVANWMTSHERIDEIEDYCNYLNQLLEIIKEDYKFDKLYVLGFSQGVSTAFRWISTMNNNSVAFYACAGTVPPELKAVDFEGKEIVVNYYYGDNDRLLNLEKAVLQIDKINELGLTVHATKFNGKHEVPKECIIDMMSTNLNRV